MEIESVEVILMSKESRFEDVEETAFELYAITTDYVTWLSDRIKNDTLNTSEECLKFAKRQKAFMLAPTALFDKITYSARSTQVDSLDGLMISGPLLDVHPVSVSDETAGKTVMQTYRDPTTFEEKTGLWYPQKTAYIVRYGVNINEPVSAMSKAPSFARFWLKTEDGYNG